LVIDWPFLNREGDGWRDAPPSLEVFMFQVSSGSILGRYELLVPVARGGMAEVWAARLHGSRGFTKLVAIKTIRAGNMDDKRLEQMFMAEAQLASLVQHPNVISTLELGEQDETLFLVMEWADAEPLSLVVKEALDDGGIPLHVAVNIIAQACRGAHCAHELTDGEGKALGVVHRDLSPQNVLVTYTGLVKLVDFGIAKVTQRASTMTDNGEVKGKLAYMSPEQVRGGDVDRRTDIFALGTMLYLLVTREHPFQGESPGETLANLCSDTPIAAPSTLNLGCPARLDAVIQRALAKRREDRFGTAYEMMLALEEAVPEAKGADLDVAKFIKALSGPRGEQRRGQIRNAGNLLDGSQDLRVLELSPSSVSGVMLGSTGTHRGTSVSHARPSYTGSLSPTHAPWLRWVAVAAAAATSIAVAKFVLTDDSSKSALGVAATAIDSAPPLSATPPAAESVGAAAPPPVVTTNPAPQVNAETSEDATGSDQTRKKPSGAREKRAAAPRAAIPVTPPPASVPAAPTASAKREIVVPPPTPAKARKADSFDPTTFGGRL
jgi:eukaryotic-like serine/threonine-protein kinase